MKFKKADHLRGGYLTLHVGGGDRRVGDKDILEGQEFEQFVKLGMLSRVPEKEAAAPAPVEPKKKPKTEKKPAAKDEDKPSEAPEPEKQDDAPAAPEPEKAVSKSAASADAMEEVVKASGSKRGRRTKK